MGRIKYLPLFVIIIWQSISSLRLLVNYLYNIFLDNTEVFDFSHLLIYTSLFILFIVSYWFGTRLKPRNVELHVFNNTRQISSLGLVLLLILLLIQSIGVESSVIYSVLGSLIWYSIALEYFSIGKLTKNIWLKIFGYSFIPFITGSKGGMITIILLLLFLLNQNDFKKLRSRFIPLTVLLLPLAIGIRSLKEGGTFNFSFFSILDFLNRFHGMEKTLGIISSTFHIDHIIKSTQLYIFEAAIPSFIYQTKMANPLDDISTSLGFSNEFNVALGTIGGSYLISKNYQILIIIVAGFISAYLYRLYNAQKIPSNKAFFFIVFVDLFPIIMEGTYFLILMSIVKIIAILIILFFIKASSKQW